MGRKAEVRGAGAAEEEAARGNVKLGGHRMDVVGKVRKKNGRRRRRRTGFGSKTKSDEGLGPLGPLGVQSDGTVSAVPDVSCACRFSQGLKGHLATHTKKQD